MKDTILSRELGPENAGNSAPNYNLISHLLDQAIHQVLYPVAPLLFVTELGEKGLKDPTKCVFNAQFFE